MPVVHQSVIYNEEKRKVTVFALNINEQESMTINLDFSSFENLTLIEHICLTGDDLHAINTFEEPENVKPVSLSIENQTGTSFDLSLPKLSWNVLRFTY